MPCVRLRRYVRFDEGEVDRWIEECKQLGRPMLRDSKTESGISSIAFSAAALEQRLLGGLSTEPSTRPGEPEPTSDESVSPNSAVSA
jgi:hypothetical protein